MAQNRPDRSRSLDRLLSRSRPPPPPPPPPRPRSLDLDRRSRDLDLDLCLQRKFGHFIVSSQAAIYSQYHTVEHVINNGSDEGEERQRVVRRIGKLALGLQNPMHLQTAGTSYWGVSTYRYKMGCSLQSPVTMDVQTPGERHGYTAVIYSRRRGHLLWQTGIALSNTHQKPTAASKSTRIKSIALISNYNPVLCCCSPYIISTLQDISTGKSSSLPLRLINAGRELKPPRTHCYHSYYQTALLNLRLPDF